MATGVWWSWAVKPDRWDRPQPRLAAGFKGLDNDHTPAAARTSVPLVVFVTIFGAVALAARRSWVGYAEKPAGQCDIVGPIGIGEEAVVTDAMEPVGQHVDQEAADELVGVQCHKLVAGVGLCPVVLPFERHARAVEGDEPAIGNSDPVSVAGQVSEHRVGSAKRPLGIDHPFELPQCSEVGFEGCWLSPKPSTGQADKTPAAMCPLGVTNVLWLDRNPRCFSGLQYQSAFPQIKIVCQQIRGTRPGGPASSPALANPPERVTGRVAASARAATCGHQALVKSTRRSSPTWNCGRN